MSGLRRVAIVGPGLIGGSIGLAIRARRPELEVIGIARKEAAAAEAVTRGAATVGSADLQVASAADLVIVATPLPEMRPVLARLGRILPETTLVTDVGSVKAPVVAWAEELLPAPERFLAGHPMAGKAESGLRAAEATLFQGAPWIFTPRPDADRIRFAEVVRLVQDLGANPVWMTADEHDRRVALVSHLAITVSAAYVAAVKAAPGWANAVEIAGPGFRDMIRLAGSDPDLSAAIARANRQELLAAIEHFEAALRKFRRHLEENTPSIWELFEESKRVHDQWTAG
jgi:prephenate dehydrogenase